MYCAESCSVQSADLELQEMETDRNRQVLAQLDSQPVSLRSCFPPSSRVSLAGLLFVIVFICLAPCGLGAISPYPVSSPLPHLLYL